MRPVPFLFFLLLLTTSAGAVSDIIATTENGKKVILRENGTWHYLGTEASDASVDQTARSMQQADQTAASSSGVKRHTLVELLKKDDKFDFRKVRWGMTKKEVTASEDAKIIKNSNDSLEFEMQLFGYDCSVVYTFAKDALDHAFFIIRQPHVDPALYYRDYNELKKYLSPLYGNAGSDRCIWKNEIYRSDSTKWGFAVSIGFLSCTTEWKNDRTRIQLSINGGNHQIVTNVAYSVLK